MLSRTARWLVTRSWRVQVTRFRCISLLRGKRLSLRNEYLKDSEAIHFELAVKWPLLRRDRSLSYKLLDDRGNVIFEPEGLRVTETTQGRSSLFAVELPHERRLTQTEVRLHVFWTSRKQPVCEVRLFQLTQEQLLGEIQTRDLEIQNRDGDRRVHCHRLHDQIESAHFLLELQLPNSKHCEVLNQLDFRISAQLGRVDSGDSQAACWQQPLYFASDRFGWNQRMDNLRSVIGGTPGEYMLSFRIKDLLVTSLKFSVVSAQEYVQMARQSLKRNVVIDQATVKTVDHQGRMVVADVIADDSKAVEIRCGLHARELDPLLIEQELSLSLGISYCDRQAPAFYEMRTIWLRRGHKTLEEFMLPVNHDIFAFGPGQYRLKLALEDRIIFEHVITFKTRSQIRTEKAEAILATLQLSNLRLFVERDRQRMETSDVFETDERMLPVFSVEATGFDEDAPVLQWRLRLKCIHLDSGEAKEHAISLRTKSSKNRYRRIGIPMNKAGARPKAGRYELHLLARERVLATCGFRILAFEEIVPYTESLVLDRVCSQNTKLWVQCGCARYLSDQVPATADVVSPELTLRSSGFNSFVQRMETPLEVLLSIGDSARSNLAEVMVTLSEDPFTVRNMALKIRSTRLGSHAGTVKLAFLIRGREIASLSFTVVSEKQLLKQIRVSELLLNVETQSGGLLKNPSALVLQEHRSIAPMVEIEVGVLAPNVIVASSLVLVADRTNVILQSDSELVLDERRKRLALPRLDLLCLRDMQGNERRLSFLVHIGEEIKATHDFTLAYVRRRLTDFEGRLITDPAKLDVDQQEYERILQSLA